MVRRPFAHELVFLAASGLCTKRVSTGTDLAWTRGGWVASPSSRTS